MVDFPGKDSLDKNTIKNALAFLKDPNMTVKQKLQFAAQMAQPLYAQVKPMAAMLPVFIAAQYAEIMSEIRTLSDDDWDDLAKQITKHSDESIYAYLEKIEREMAEEKNKIKRKENTKTAESIARNVYREFSDTEIIALHKTFGNILPNDMLTTLKNTFNDGTKSIEERVRRNRKIYDAISDGEFKQFYADNENRLNYKKLAELACDWKNRVTGPALKTMVTSFNKNVTLVELNELANNAVNAIDELIAIANDGKLVETDPAKTENLRQFGDSLAYILQAAEDALKDAGLKPKGRLLEEALVNHVALYNDFVSDRIENDKGAFPRMPRIEPPKFD